MQRRGYTCNINNFDKYGLRPTNLECGYGGMPYYKLFNSWHNDRYLKQCYYNLQEKYDCGGISENDWIVINNFMEDKL